jgi:hypothetical protein
MGAEAGIGTTRVVPANPQKGFRIARDFQDCRRRFSASRHVSYIDDSCYKYLGGCDIVQTALFERMRP